MVDYDELYRCCLGHSQRWYWWKEGNKYHYKCLLCGHEGVIDKQLFEEVKYAKVCPYCYNDVKILNYRSPFSCHRFMRTADNGNTQGYWVDVTWDRCKGMYNCVASHVLKEEGNDIYVYGIRKNMYTLTFVQDLNKPGWRKLSHKSKWTYLDCFYWVYDANASTKKRKEFLEEIQPRGISFKSNQIEFIKKHVVTTSLLDYIYHFDINKWEDIWKYRDYVKHNALPHQYDNKRLNVAYLDYLARNNIGTHVYGDYLEQCDQLGVKYDKPKHFDDKHNEFSRIIADKRDKQINEDVMKRFDEVSKKYDGAPFIVFADANEIRTVAQSLHNCMASNYMRKYAEGTTDIFYGKSDQGEILYGIEIHDHRLMQLYGAYNKPVSEEIQREIINWCKSNNIKCNLYGGQTI